MLPVHASHLSAVGVVVPAAGAGVRMGAGPAKQFRHLGGAPVVVQTLRALLACPLVEHAVVAVPAAGVEATAALLAGYEVGATVVAGGATRGASVRLGMEALPPAVATVLVHDAVRPFVTTSLVARVAAAVAEHGAAAAAVPVADTLRRAADGALGATVERDGLWAMQTPQGARRDLLSEAYARLGDDASTDEAGLLLAAGTPVHIVEGDARNLKLTRASDAALAEALWNARRAAG